MKKDIRGGKVTPVVREATLGISPEAQNSNICSTGRGKPINGVRNSLILIVKFRCLAPKLDN